MSRNVLGKNRLMSQKNINMPDQVCAVCNTTKKRFIILSEPILESNLEFRQLNIEEANLIVILKCHHSFTEVGT
ncbi:hypothetical protein glysoja_022146 [Glycine soja]|nr:hypothetical protein glysoja_022146 [Glycine soja]